MHTDLGDVLTLEEAARVMRVKSVRTVKTSGVPIRDLRPRGSKKPRPRILRADLEAWLAKRPRID